MLKVDYLKKLFLNIGLFTIIIARMASIVEWDSKKIIAYSTLRQLGIMVLCIFLGLKKIRYFHLIIHAFFKSLMFIIIGYLLINNFHFQDIRLLSNLWNKKKIFSFILLFIKYCLSGFFFFGSFFIKDLIYENNFFISNLIFIIIFYLRLILTFIYSFRLTKILFFCQNKKIKIKKNKKYKILFLIKLLIFRLLIGYYFFFFF